MPFNSSKQLIAGLILCCIAPSNQRATPPAVNLTIWLQHMQNRLRRHTSPPTPLLPVWKQPCRRGGLIRHTRTAATLSRQTQLEIYAANLDRNAGALSDLLADLCSWTNTSRLNSAVRQLFRNAPLPGTPRVLASTSGEPWPSIRLALKFDQVLARLAIYMQLFRRHMQRIKVAANFGKTQRAEELMLRLLCHMHHFTSLHFQRELRWPSEELTVANVVPPIWRNASGTVQILGHLRNFMACKEAAHMVAQFRQVIRSGARLV